MFQEDVCSTGKLDNRCLSSCEADGTQCLSCFKFNQKSLQDVDTTALKHWLKALPGVVHSDEIAEMDINSSHLCIL